MNTNANTGITVTLSPEIRLEQALSETGVDNPASVTKLTIAGTLTKNDLDFITDKMRKTLKELDMSGALVGENNFGWTFGGCRFTSVILPDSLNEVGNSAFLRCKRLKSVIIPDSVAEIKEYAFTGCWSLKSIFIPKSVKKIDNYAFDDSTSITVHPDNPVYTGKNGKLKLK